MDKWIKEKGPAIDPKGFLQLMNSLEPSLCT